MRYDDGYTVGDVIHLAARQKHLNFPPGTEYDYSNTGYIALGRHRPARNGQVAPGIRGRADLRAARDDELALS